MEADELGGVAPVAWSWAETPMTADAERFALPTGTVAFLLTDVEGSTLRWEAEPDQMAAAMDRHNALLDEVVSAHGGVCPPAQGEGDSIVAAFPRASDAVLAAVAAQRLLADQAWPTSPPLLVRMAVHAGEARFVDDGNYAGHAIIRTARLRAIAQGGQVLVSASAHDLTVDQLGDAVGFRDLGEHRLRDLARPERVWQLVGDGLIDEFEPLQSLDAHPHNLPVQLSTFVGRSEEIATVARLVGTERLVTVTGAGGAGKTRLAQRVAADVLDTLDAGAWWVELAELTDVDQVPGAIARATGVKAEVGDDELDALVERLAGKRLLVLDNCEHIVAGVAALVDLLLRRCPDLRLLATSREPLGVDGELTWRIPPLGVPPTGDGGGGAAAVAALQHYDAVRLFVDRAQRVRPNFHLDDQTGPVVADICQRLDGIPLAIELAASRCRSLRPQQIRDGLTESFDLLTGGVRAALPRQQTLEASIAWSHQLLTPPEQMLFRRLSAFRGGCVLDDAEVVVADDALPSAEVLDLLDRLVAQSLLVVDDGGNEQRFRMLETVRQFAAHRLAEAGEAEALAERHAHHFVDKLIAVGPSFEVDFDLDALRWSVEEMDNIDDAVRATLSAGRTDEAIGATWHLGLAWGLVDPPGCERLMAAVLEAAETEAQQAKALIARAQLRLWEGDMLQCAIDAMTGIEIAERIGEEWLANRGRVYLGQVVVWVDPDEGLRVHRQAAEVARAQGDLTAEALAVLGLGSCLAGILTDIVTGQALMDEGMALARKLGNPLVISWGASQLAISAAFRAEFEEAEARANEAEGLLSMVGRTLGVGGLRLSQGTVIGGVIAFTRAYSRTCRDTDDAYLDALPAIAAEATEAGYFVTQSLLEISYAIKQTNDGNLDAAEAAFARCRAISERAGTEASGVAAAPYWSDLALAHGDLAEAKRRLATVTDTPIARRSFHARSRIALRGAAFALVEGSPLDAERHAHEALALAAEQSLWWEVIHALELLAQVAVATDSLAEAARIAGAVEQLRARTGVRVLLAWHADHFDAAVEVTRTGLGDDAFDVAFAEGRALSTDDAIAYVRRTHGERKRPSFGWDGLTPTELQVVEHVTLGRTNPEIASAMFVSRETIKTHLSHVFAKLGVSSRSELAVAAARRDDLTPTTEPNTGATS